MPLTSSVQDPQGHVPRLPLGLASVPRWQWHPDSYLPGCHGRARPQLYWDRLQPDSARDILPAQHPLSQWGFSQGDHLWTHLPGLRRQGHDAGNGLKDPTAPIST